MEGKMGHSLRVERRERNTMDEGDLVTIGEDTSKYRILHVIPYQAGGRMAWIGPPSLSGAVDVETFKRDLKDGLLNQEKYDDCHYIDASILRKVPDA